MTLDKLVDIINKKFRDLEIDNIPDELYFNFRDYFVVNFSTLNVSDCTNMVFVGHGSIIETHEYFNDENEAHKFFNDCVKLFK